MSSFDQFTPALILKGFVSLSCGLCLSSVPGRASVLVNLLLIAEYITYPGIYWARGSLLSHGTVGVASSTASVFAMAWQFYLDLLCGH